jgi:hypothetical protein
MEFRIGDIKTKYEIYSLVIRELEYFDGMRVKDMSEIVTREFSRALLRVLEAFASIDPDNKRFNFRLSHIFSSVMHPAVVSVQAAIFERENCKSIIERYESFFKDPVVIAAQEAKYKAGLARAEVRKKFGDDYDTLVEWGLI